MWTKEAQSFEIFCKYNVIFNGESVRGVYENLLNKVNNACWEAADFVIELIEARKHPYKTTSDTTIRNTMC